MSGKRSNISLLTEGADYIQRAKKARQGQVEEIKFDDEARREWLSGFSKRKKARTDERRARAKKRDHEAHLEGRRKARQELKERAAQNVKDVRAALGLAPLDEGSDDDVDDDDEAGPSKIEEQEYSDDDQMATVTIEDDFDPSSTRSTRAYAADSDDEGGESKPAEAVVPIMPASSKRAEARAKRDKEKAKAAKDLAKKKERKSTSMETPAERRRAKELDARKRNKKYEKEQAQAEKYGVTLVQRKSGQRTGKGGKLTSSKPKRKGNGGGGGRGKK